MTSTYTHRKKITDEEKKLAKRISIEKLADHLLHKTPSGKHLCSIHGATSGGSFSINKVKNTCTCYKCGTGNMDTIEFVAKYQGKSFPEAVRYILEKIETGELTPKGVTNETENITLSTIREKEYIHKVYSAFVNASIILSRDVDLRNRSVVGYESRYFNIPSATDPLFKEIFMGQLRCWGIPINHWNEYEHFAGVPGFYRYNNETCFVSAEGMGIIQRDLNENITALQFRRSSVKENQSKYVLFSSGSKQDGCSIGQIPDVYFPKGMKNGKALITEGSFKAVMAATDGYTSLSINGISSLQPVHDFAKYCRDKELVVEIALDSEYSHMHIVGSIAKIVDILADYSVVFTILTWDPRCGKGYDDVKSNGYGEYISAIPANLFFAEVKKLSNEVNDLLERLNK